MSIVDFPGVTRLDIPAERVLEWASKKDLKSVVVMGYTEDGDEYFASSIADGGEVVWLIERAKLKLLTVEPDDL